MPETSTAADQFPFLLHNLYFQANTIHGYRFFDDSGRILNSFADFYEEVGNGLDGVKLSLPKPDSNMPWAIRVDSQRIWFQYLNPDSLQESLRQIVGLVRDIARILEVQRHSRLGLRCEYYFPTPRDSVLTQQLGRTFVGELLASELDLAPNDSEFQVIVRGNVKGTNATVNIRSARVTEAPKNAGDFEEDCIIVDIDAFEGGTIEGGDVPPFLRRAREAIDARMLVIGRAMTSLEGAR